MVLGHDAWRMWCCCMGFGSSGKGCQGHICCCRVKAGKPTAVPDQHEFWSDNDKLDCNLVCCGWQIRSNPTGVAATPAQTAYTAPPPQHMPPPTSGDVAMGQPVQPQQQVYHEPIKPGKETGYPTVN